jgi:PAS domain S-box-containing protein
MSLPVRLSNDQRVLIFAPAGRDSAASRSILSRAGIETLICTGTATVCREVESGAGALLVGEEAATPTATNALSDALALQPSWSDLPILMLTGPGPDSAAATIAAAKLGNVTLLERPVRVVSLVSAVRAALRARQRQYELRDRLSLQTLLAAIVESSDDAIVGKTPEGIILTWNKAAERLFGYRAEEAVGRPITIVIPPDRLDEERRILANIIRGERMTHFETVRMTRDGRRLDVSLTISPIRDTSGRIVGASKVARDISAQKKAEQALREADRRKDEFLAMLAHELRNPLAPIRNSLTLLEIAGQADPTIERVRGILERQVGHMVRLVDDLMEVSRITRGTIELRRERLNLADAIRSALETSEPLIRRAALDAALELPPQALYVDADPVRLTQIISNLLNNAAKYSDRSRRVVLTARGEDGEAVVSVRDFGVGIPADMLERVFDMFAQVPGQGRGGQGGLGIGLTLVRSLVQMHGGSIAATSEGAGKGSTFTFRLPLVEAPARSPARPTRRAARGLSLRVLVVDDNRDAADSMGLVLARAGAEVEVVHDGATALDRVERFHPALVLLDIGMPGMDGYEVARRIRARPALHGIQLVALTGWGQAEDRLRSREAGFDHHLIKPAGIDELCALLPSTRDNAGPRG